MSTCESLLFHVLGPFSQPQMPVVATPDVIATLFVRSFSGIVPLNVPSRLVNRELRLVETPSHQHAECHCIA